MSRAGTLQRCLAGALRPARVVSTLTVGHGSRSLTTGRRREEGGGGGDAPRYSKARTHDRAGRQQDTRPAKPRSSATRPTKMGLPLSASMIQREIWDEQVQLSKSLQFFADNMAAATAANRLPNETDSPSSSSPASAATAAKLNLQWASQAEALVKEAKPRQVRSVVIFNQRIKIALMAGLRNDAFRLYNQMKKHNLAPTAYTFSILCSGIAKLALAKPEDHSMLVSKDSKDLAQQISSIAQDLLQLHVNASMFWVVPVKRKLSSVDIDQAQSEYEVMLEYAELSDAQLIHRTAAERMTASRARAAYALKDNWTPLARAWSDYLRLLSRTAPGQPALVWTAYESLRRATARPPGIDEWEFARPYRSKAVFTTMLWTVIQQVSSRSARMRTSQVVRQADAASRALSPQSDSNSSDPKDEGEANTKEADAQNASFSWEDGSSLFDIPTDLNTPSTPFGQARQLWLDWEAAIAEAETKQNATSRLTAQEWAELSVDERAYSLFVDFFDKCHTEPERAFGEHVRGSGISKEVRAAVEERRRGGDGDGASYRASATDRRSMRGSTDRGVQRGEGYDRMERGPGASGGFQRAQQRGDRHGDEQHKAAPRSARQNFPQSDREGDGVTSREGMTKFRRGSHAGPPVQNKTTAFRAVRALGIHVPPHVKPAKAGRRVRKSSPRYVFVAAAEEMERRQKAKREDKKRG
ncbi:hypothetical protein OC844_001573 [Tilletia horrida]|nr:hypothetical protein OC844_001573 [Tilletia horrida]